MTFQQFATSEFGTKLWMGLGRWLPLPAGYALARIVTRALNRNRDSSLYRILYANQAGVLGEGATPAQLREAVRAVLAHAGMTSFDLMHLLAAGEEKIRRAIEWPDAAWETIRKAYDMGRGVVLCGCHCSNFNLGFLSFALRDLPVQVLSVSEPSGGFKILHDLRNRGMLEETPIDGPALRSAIRRLRAGGTAVTGVDWPVETGEEDYLPFFGKPAMLPTGHIRIAMSANAVLLPLACRWAPDRGYYVETGPHLELELTGDREADVRHNALRVLAVCERWIAEAPDQWLMYHRIWPEGATASPG